MTFIILGVLLLNDLFTSEPEQLNGLLVIRQIDNISPGGVPGGKLVPGSHKRCKLGHLCDLTLEVKFISRLHCFLSSFHFILTI